MKFISQVSESRFARRQMSSTPFRRHTVFYEEACSAILARTKRQDERARSELRTRLSDGVDQREFFAVFTIFAAFVVQVEVP